MAFHFDKNHVMADAGRCPHFPPTFTTALFTLHAPELPEDTCVCAMPAPHKIHTKEEYLYDDQGTGALKKA